MNFEYNHNILIDYTNLEHHIENKEENYLYVKIISEQYIEEFIKIYYKFDKVKLALDMNTLLLENIPDSIFDFTNLIELNISNNLINNIPNKIINLVNLKMLSICSCKLEKIPNFLSNLVNLEDLRIGRNKLKEFPSVICEMKNLKYLYINNNNISSIPNSIKNLKNLTTLCINNNNIKTYPFSIHKLQKLKAICVEDCLSKYPLIFRDLQNFDISYRNGNKLKSLSDKRLIFRLYFLMCKSSFFFNKLKIINNYKILEKIIKF
jgi:Leucine-rich repeat (LRR) protein